MTRRDDYVHTLLGRPAERRPFWLFWGPWGRAWQRWQSEGMPCRTWEDVLTFFGAQDARPNIPVNCGPCPAIPRQVLAEDDRSVTHIDSWGITCRDLKGNESMSEFIKFPVANRDDWERFRRQHLIVGDARRLEGDWLTKARRWAAEGQALRLGAYPDVGIFGTYRWLLGDEECLVGFYSDPELAHDIMKHMTDLYLGVWEQVVREVRVDEIHLWEDLSGKQGPLMSPAHWREFIGPCYRRIKAFADGHEIPLFSVDTDGNPEVIIQPMLDAGVNVLLPLEVAAGCDVNALQRKYPSLGVVGGVDKRALARTPEAIDAEIARIAPAIAAGRYIPTLDHLVPDDVSWKNYCHFARSMRTAVESA